jgi:hypothetical protein
MRLSGPGFRRGMTGDSVLSSRRGFWLMNDYISLAKFVVDIVALGILFWLRLAHYAYSERGNRSG